MPDLKYIISVTATGSDAIAGPIVAIALAHRVTDTIPAFRYEKNGVKKVVPLESFHQLPTPYRLAALEHLGRSAVAYTPLVRPPSLLREDADVGAVTLELMGLATVRAMERLIHTCPDVPEGQRENFLWQVHGAQPLPEKYVYGRQELVPEPSASTWQVIAASLLAKASRDAFMMRAARMHPNYRFDKHMGFATKTHKAEIKKHGRCSEHWSHS